MSRRQGRASAESFAASDSHQHEMHGCCSTYADDDAIVSSKRGRDRSRLNI